VIDVIAGVCRPLGWRLIQAHLTDHSHKMFLQKTFRPTVFVARDLKSRGSGGGVVAGVNEPTDGRGCGERGLRQCRTCGLMSRFGFMDV
jgi:hypothetical protein